MNLNNNGFDRQAWAGLVTPVGGFLAGRQYTPAFETFGTPAGFAYTARTMAQLRDLLFPTTAYTGASTGWTAVTGVGSAAASGTDYDLSLASGETGASEVYPTTDHPRLHRDVSAQLAGEEVSPISDHRGGAAYRRAMAVTLTRRLLRGLVHEGRSHAPHT